MIKVIEVKEDFKVHKVTLAHQVCRGHKDIEAIQGQGESKEIKDHQDFKEDKDQED